MLYSKRKSRRYPAPRRLPDAVAVINGSQDYSQINGTVRFYSDIDGVLVIAEIFGLPTASVACGNGVFGFHIHEGGKCSPTADNPFRDAGMHYNPHSCPHPYHAGDMPPIFAGKNTSYLAFLSTRFSIDEIVGKTVIIHDSPDDFTTQPSGASGKRIACGIISRVKRI